MQPGEPDYESSVEVGQTLAKAGYAVMTGGYAGVMEAVSKGAASVNGHVIGVTTETIEVFRGGGIRINEWVTDEVRHPSLQERVAHLILEADGYVAMPGGLGTLHELVSVWELIRVGDVPKRPVICYGKYWEEMLASLRQTPYIPQPAWDVLRFVHSPQEMLVALKELDNEP